MPSTLPAYVYIVTSYTQDTDGKYNDEEMDQTHGVWESVEDANEEALRQLRNHYSGYDTEPGFIERWTDDGTNSYTDGGCLYMDSYPEEA